jgi:hypothetical protein
MRRRRAECGWEDLSERARAILRLFERDEQRRRWWTLGHVADALSLTTPPERTSAIAALNHLARAGLVNRKREAGCAAEYSLNTRGGRLLAEQDQQRLVA